MADHPRPFGRWLAAIALLLFAAFTGLAVAVMDTWGAAVIVALFLGMISLFLPVRYFIVLFIFLTFVVVGQLEYFAHIQRAFWIPFLLGLVLLVRFPAELMRRNKQHAWQASFQPKQASSVTLLLGIYFATLIATTLINFDKPLQVFVSGKEYFFLWSIYLVIAGGMINPALLTRIWSYLLWLLPLQLPIIFYQRFVVSAQRADKYSAAWDAVVGAFGGNPDGGGASGAMGIFVVFAIAMALCQWRQHTLRGWHCFLIVGSGLIAILLAEVKFAVLMLPVVIGIAFLRDVFARPLAALGGIFLSVALAGLLLFAYEKQYWSDYQQKHIGSYTGNVFAGSVDPDSINMETGEMGRIAAIKFWMQRQTNVVHSLIGQGPGASRKGALVVGNAAKPWPFNIDRSTLVILLWEVGILGTASFVLMLCAAAWRAYKLSGDVRLPAAEHATLRACSAGLVLLMLALPYNTDIIYSPQIQILLILILGQLAIAGGRFASSSPPSVASAIPRHAR